MDNMPVWELVAAGEQGEEREGDRTFAIQLVKFAEWLGTAICPCGHKLKERVLDSLWTNRERIDLTAITRSL